MTEFHEHPASSSNTSGNSASYSQELFVNMALPTNNSPPIASTSSTGKSPMSNVNYATGGTQELCSSEAQVLAPPIRELCSSQAPVSLLPTRNALPSNEIFINTSGSNQELCASNAQVLAPPIRELFVSQAPVSSADTRTVC